MNALIYRMLWFKILFFSCGFAMHKETQDILRKRFHGLENFSTQVRFGQAGLSAHELNKINFAAKKDSLESFIRRLPEGFKLGQYIIPGSSLFRYIIYKIDHHSIHIIACIEFGNAFKEEKNEAVIDLLWASPVYGGAGLGKFLLTLALNKLKSLGKFKRVILHLADFRTGKDNKNVYKGMALSLYKSFGFQDHSFKEGYLELNLDLYTPEGLVALPSKTYDFEKSDLNSFYIGKIFKHGVISLVRFPAGDFLKRPTYAAYKLEGDDIVPLLVLNFYKKKIASDKERDVFLMSGYSYIDKISTDTILFALFKYAVKDLQKEYVPYLLCEDKALCQKLGFVYTPLLKNFIYDCLYLNAQEPLASPTLTEGAATQKVEQAYPSKEGTRVAHDDTNKKVIFPNSSYEGIVRKNKIFQCVVRYFREFPDYPKQILNFLRKWLKMS